jgi:hypothetical protein
MPLHSSTSCDTNVGESYWRLPKTLLRAPDPPPTDVAPHKSRLAIGIDEIYM